MKDTKQEAPKTAEEAVEEYLIKLRFSSASIDPKRDRDRRFGFLAGWQASGSGIVPQSAGVRPNIENYFDSMGEALKQYADSPKLFNYVRDLDNYIDKLESIFGGQDAGQDETKVKQIKN